MMEGWIKRPKGTTGIPAGLMPDAVIEVRLEGDDGEYRFEADEVNWRDGPGAVAEYRVLAPVAPRAHGHYFKPVAGLNHVDVYRVLELFGVTDQALGHAVKKLLVAGGRGGGKDVRQDVQEAIDTLARWQEMRAEDSARAGHFAAAK